jgi:hypothetical protein
VVVGEFGAVVFGNEGVKGDVARSMLCRKFVSEGEWVYGAAGKVVSDVGMIARAINGWFVLKETVCALVGF